MVKYEDIEPGDVLVCNYTESDCCLHRGERYEVEENEDYGDELVFKLSCFDRYQEYGRVRDYVTHPKHEFSLEKKAGPW